MQTIGERLEEARKRKGVSVREAAEATKIRGDYLHKLESNGFDLNLPEIYVRGFLRSYANYLKLNPDKILADYKAQTPGEPRSSRRDNREIYGHMDLGQPAHPETEAPAEAEVREPAPVQRARPSFSPAPAGAGFPPINPALLVKGGIAVIVIILVTVVYFGVKSTSSGPHKPTVNIKPVAERTITFFAREAARIKVVQDFDGSELFQGSLAKGESRSFPMRGSVSLTAQPFENVQVEVNGRPVAVPPMTGLKKVVFE